MKTFYTERDIVDLHAAGTTEIVVDDHVVLTDLAREKVNDLGIQLKSGDSPPPSPATPTASSSPPAPSYTDIVGLVKSRVIARLGTSDYNDLLDQVIPQVLAQMTSNQKSSSSSSAPSDSY